MADIKQAAQWLRDGLRVRRSGWNEKSFIQSDFMGINDMTGEIYTLWGPHTLLATDWELYEEQDGGLEDIRRHN